MKKENIIQSLKIVALGLMVAVGLSYAFAWTAPTSNPPSGNVAAPINVSGVSQTKTGSLWSDNFIGSSGGGYFGGDLEVANGKGITLGGVYMTSWPSGGVANWNTMINKPAGFADNVDNEQVKSSKIYQCPTLGVSSCRNTCNGQLTTGASCYYYSSGCSRGMDGNPRINASCTFLGYLVQ
ncbi:MAG: hypothetical protein NUV64_01325 [Parcubacteria group bacterium]|nr:hypothetical protein [Parcubacteria group bacterium]MCR4343001.1 hypothetical protein [Patescibacteria group bacterium]